MGAPAKAGALAPIDVFIPASNTGLGPEKTSFFQALSIATKISRGTIEIMSEVHLVKFEEKVGASEAALLQMLKIFPFSYGLKIVQGNHTHSLVCNVKLAQYQHKIPLFTNDGCLHPIYLPLHTVFEGGSVFPPSILDIKEEDLIQLFFVVS